jgi:hypothetical protein
VIFCEKSVPGTRLRPMTTSERWGGFSDESGDGGPPPWLVVLALAVLFAIGLMALFPW